MCLMPLLGQWGQWAADRAPVFSFVVWHLPVTLTRQRVPPVGKLNIFTCNWLPREQEQKLPGVLGLGPELYSIPWPHPILFKGRGI